MLEWNRLEPKNWLPIAVRQRLRRAEAGLRGEPAKFVYGQAYEHELPGVPIDHQRGERILLALIREGLVGRDSVLAPELASIAKLERVHDPDYIAALHSPEVIEATFGLAVPDELAAEVVELQRQMCGGTILAAHTAYRQHKLVANLGGGLHHAQRDRGRGFCLINDVAVAIAALRAEGMTQNIAVVDLDIHDGDGTRALFADDPSVWTFSIHNEHWGPTDAASSTSIALGDKVEDARYLGALRQHLPAMLDQHRPRLVIYVAGCDPAAEDFLGNWNISEAGMLARDRFVIDALHERGIHAIVWLLGGGYGSDAWRHTARGLIAALGGPSNPRLPTAEAVTLARYRELAKVLDPAELSESAALAKGAKGAKGDKGAKGEGSKWGRADPLGAGLDLNFDESDLFGTTPHSGPTTPRVLGFYTQAGVELALERYGLLPRLREMGFDPRVEIDCGDETGDTIRVFGGAGSEMLLVEVRVARDRLTLAGMELLRIEWMLLQNPRASWTAGRAPLPGQRHPGLRMFEEVALLLLMVCERLDLAGIVVVPSHYHVASRWHGRMRFWDPVVEGRFRALERVLDPLPLAEASMAVELGRVVDLDLDLGLGGAERRSYEPAPLILPWSEGLARRFDGDWEQAVAAAEAGAHFALER